MGIAKPVTRKRNPQDATLRNIRALKARVVALEKQTGFLRSAVITLAAEIDWRGK